MSFHSLVRVCVCVCACYFRRGRHFASCCSWWRTNIPTRTSQTWSLSSSAHGTWVRRSKLLLLYYFLNSNTNVTQVVLVFLFRLSTRTKICGLMGVVPRPREDSGWDDSHHPSWPVCVWNPGKLGVWPGVGGVDTCHVEGTDWTGL